MKKTKFILIVITLLLACILSACGESSGKTSGASANSGTRTYHGEDGDVQVPAKPKRVAVLAHIYVGNVLKLGITPVAVNEWVKGNKFFGDKLRKYRSCCGRVHRKVNRIGARFNYCFFV